MQQISLFPVPRGRPRLHQNNAAKQRYYRQKRAKDWAEAQAKLKEKAYHQRGRDDYETPWHVFDPYNDEFAFTLDVCALPTTRKCARYFSPADDGLAQDWGTDICWMNPPFSAVAQWMRKAYESSLAGATVVCLVPARTDTRWWHAWVQDKADIRWRARRIKFLLDGVRTKNSAGFPAVAVIYRP
jgi:site-specific DNA-methyltransferase (adenine-specific)